MQKLSTKLSRGPSRHLWKKRRARCNRLIRLLMFTPVYMYGIILVQETTVLLHFVISNYRIYSVVSSAFWSFFIISCGL